MRKLPGCRAPALRMALLGSISLFAFGGPAFAAQAGDPTAVLADAEADDGGAIVITGSRIARSGIDAPTPTVAVGAADIEAKGVTNVVDLLNQLPQISTGLSNANTSFSFGNVGLNQIDLRNLGVRRTLTLVNGRRRAGTPDDSNFLAFDLSNIPTALIERVEVQTGGTSAVYGADAVAGVVNIMLKKDFEGLEAFGQYGITGRGDYHTASYGVTLGTNYERGNAVVHVSRSENGLLTRGEAGQAFPFAFVSNPANTGPNDGIPARIPRDDLRFAYFGFPAMTSVLPFGPGGAWTDVIYDPALQTFRPLNAGPDGVIDGTYSAGEGGTSAADTRIAPLTRTNIYAKADYEFNDSLKFVTEAIFADTKAVDRIGSVFDSWSTSVSIDNPFMPQAVRDGLIAAGQDSFGYAREHSEFGMRMSKIHRQYYSIAAGFEGNIGSNWNWSVVGEYGKSSTSNSQFNDRIDQRWFDASDAILDPVTGQIVCRSVEARAQGCVPVNVFGTGTISQAAVDYISANHTSVTDTSQTLVQGLVSGDLLQLPAGAVKVSAGLEYRKDALDFRPSYVWEQAAGFFASQFSPVKASNDVREAFAEVLVPVLRNQPFAHSLELEGAFRISDYERAGTVDSWKIAGSWAPVRDVRFRVNKAKAVRAPSLGEMFDPGSRGATGLTDPCDPLVLDAGSASRRANCAALGLDPVTFDPNTRRMTTLLFTTGNPNLDVEKGDTLTAGVVVNPRWIPGLSLSADWYRIKLDGGIVRIGAQKTADNCVDLPTLNNEFCDFVTRGPGGDITEVRDSYVNASSLKVEGVDFELSYRTNLNDLLGGNGNLGSFSLRGIASYLKDNITAGLDDAGEADNPKFRATLNAAYHNGPFRLTWASRFVGRTVTNNDAVNPKEDIGKYYHIPSVWYHDASVGYDGLENLSLYAGVNNLFDTSPRYHPFTYRGTSAYDDVIGRFFYVGAKLRFGRN